MKDIAWDEKNTSVLLILASLGLLVVFKYSVIVGYLAAEAFK